MFDFGPSLVLDTGVQHWTLVSKYLKPDNGLIIHFQSHHKTVVMLRLRSFGAFRGTFVDHTRNSLQLLCTFEVICVLCRDAEFLFFFTYSNIFSFILEIHLWRIYDTNKDWKRQTLR